MLFHVFFSVPLKFGKSETSEPRVTSNFTQSPKTTAWCWCLGNKQQRNQSTTIKRWCTIHRGGWEEPAVVRGAMQRHLGWHEGERASGKMSELVSTIKKGNI